MKKDKLFSFINISGLSIGSTVIILLSLFVNDEVTYDNFHKDSDLIYRAWVKEHVSGEVFFNTYTPYILGSELKAKIPDFEDVFRYTTANVNVRNGDFRSSELIHTVEAPFLKVLNFPLQRGNIEEVLADPYNVVLTPETANKYFGKTDCIGQTLSIQLGDGWLDYNVAGIIESPPSNSGFQFNILLPFKNADYFIGSNAKTSWTNVNVETFVKLKPEADISRVEAKVQSFMDDMVSGIYAPGEYIVGFQKLTDIHLNDEIPVGILPVSNPRYPFILGSLALLVLILASINFATLAVARSVKRSREVGIRKTVGASRVQLMAQFWSEAIVTSGISVVIGVILAHVLLPFYNTLINKQLYFEYSLKIVGFGLLLVLVIGLVSGAYPSIVLSRTKTINSLRDKIVGSVSIRSGIMKWLVGFQFVLSTILICCTMIIFRQIDFLENYNLGFDKEKVVVIPYNNASLGFIQLFEEGKRLKKILAEEIAGSMGETPVAISNHTPGTPGWMQIGYTDQETNAYNTITLNGVDEYFLPVHNISLASGRNFNNSNGSDAKSVIINEVYASRYNITLNDNLQSPFEEYQVIGISKDFNYESLHTRIEPLIMALDPVGIIRKASDFNTFDSPAPKFTVKVLNDDLSGSIETIKSAWNKIVTDQDFSFSFLDQNIDNLYRSEKLFATIITIATSLSIFIAMLGLFGITSLLVSQKQKEIGIRKILGASMANIVIQLNKGFISVLLIASLLGIMVAWYAMNKWLQDFEFKTELSWWIFFTGSLVAIVVAIITVSIKSLNAAGNNPVKVLRSNG